MTSSDITMGVSDVVEWQIPNFPSITEDTVDSSRFSLGGCTWFLSVHSLCEVALYVCLEMVTDDVTVDKTVTFSLGIKNKDGILEFARRYPNRTFTRGNPYEEHVVSHERLLERQSELLPSGTLTVVCLMEREVSSPEEVAPNQGKVDSRLTMLVELETLSSDLKDLLTNDRKSDFTINVQGKEFRTHRYLLSARSSVFRAMLEHDTAEAKSGILTIPDCDPESFGEFLGFLYTGKTEEVTYRTAYHLYATGEKYDVQQLKSFCASYLKQNLTPENVCDVVVLADRYSDDELLSSTQNFFNENYCKIFLTSEWTTLLKSNIRLVQKLLSEMASATLKTP